MAGATMSSGVRFLEPASISNSAMLINEPMTLTSIHFNPKKSNKVINRRSILKREQRNETSSLGQGTQSSFYNESSPDFKRTNSSTVSLADHQP